MSNVTRKIKKYMSKPNPLYTTLIGSIITSVGMICGKSEIQNRKLFTTLNKNKITLKPYDTVEKLCDYIFAIHGDKAKEELFKSKTCLVYDEAGIRMPLVCLFTYVQDEEGNLYPKLLPLDPKGYLYGVMQSFEAGSPNVFMESVFDKEETEGA